MQVLLATMVVFVIAFLGMAIGVIRGKRCRDCSCKAASQIMKSKSGQRGACASKLYDL